MPFASRRPQVETQLFGKVRDALTVGTEAGFNKTQEVVPVRTGYLKAQGGWVVQTKDGWVAGQAPGEGVGLGDLPKPEGERIQGAIFYDTDYAFFVHMGVGGNTGVPFLHLGNDALQDATTKELVK